MSHPPGGQRRCLVVGSYPPVPGPASAATLAVVRELWAAGAEVIVASPRPSAAHEVVADVGAAAAARVATLAARHGCTEVVACLERGWPFLAYERQPRLGLWAPDLRTRAVKAWASCLAGFDHAQLSVNGEVGLTPSLLSLLWVHSDRVLTTSVVTAARLRALGAPQVEVLAPWPLPDYLSAPDDDHGRPVAVVGPLEPGVLSPASRARHLVGASARKVLGAREPAVRRAVAKTVGVVRRPARRAGR